MADLESRALHHVLSAERLTTAYDRFDAVDIVVEAVQDYRLRSP